MGISTASAAAPALESETSPASLARERKIEILRDLYRTGTYHVDAQKLAVKIIEAHLDE